MSTNKKNNSPQSRHEDEVLTRALIWIGGAAVMLLLLLLGNRYYVNYRAGEIPLMAALKDYVLPALAAAGVAACAVLSYVCVRRAKEKKAIKWIVAPAVFCGVLGVATAIVWQFHASGVQAMFAIIPTIAVLALVYYLFQREFFLIALASAVGILGLWIVRRAADGSTVVLYAYLFAAALFLAALAVLTRKLQQAEGMWKGKRVLSKKAAYPVIYATCAVMAVLLAAALVAGAGVTYFLMFPAVGWLVIMAVYFTVRLM